MKTRRLSGGVKAAQDPLLMLLASGLKVSKYKVASLPARVLGSDGGVVLRLTFGECIGSRTEDPVPS